MTILPFFSIIRSFVVLVIFNFINEDIVAGMEIKPFRAFRFNAEIVGDVGGCISPPYDVIDACQQQQLYEKSQYNIVRIIKGKTTSSDNKGNNQYTRAADYFKAWIEKGILKQDPMETIYAYIQDFRLAGARFQRSSFIALSKIEELGKTVKPHEYTLEEPKIDRLNLKRATKADLELVFMLYDDPNQIADKIIENTARVKTLIDFIDEQNARHRLFAIAAEENINAIIRMMSSKSCIIADGHHRYETGLNYLKEASNPAAGYQMTAFVNTCHGGLIILATHRLVAGLKDFKVERLVAQLKENFEITEHPFDSDQAKAEAKQNMLAQMKTQHNKHKNAFGIYGGQNKFYVATLKSKRAMDSANSNISRARRELDVFVLHKLILEKILGIDDEGLESGNYIEYVKDTDNAIDVSITKVDTGQKQVAFFLNPIKIKELKKVTEAGEKLPQKSTFFYPKMYSGLTIYKL